MKVMIAYPPLEGRGTPTLGQNRQFQWFHNPSYIYPLVPASAATVLARDGFDVLWVDAIAEGWRADEFMRFVNKIQPDVIVMETKTPVVKQHWRIVKELKSPAHEGSKRPLCVLMGDHVTALPRETLESCPVDFVLLGGDYDAVLLALVRWLRAGTGPVPPGIWHRRGDSIENSGPAPEKIDLDSLPFVDRELTRWRTYGEKLYRRTPFTYTMAGRDCPYGKCTFCSWTTLYPRFHVRSPSNLIEEIEQLVTRHGVREIFDDTGTFPSGGWLDEFCRLMVESGLSRRVLFSSNFRFDYLLAPGRAEMMKRAGFRLMKLGLESANQRTLDRLRKGTKVGDITEGCRIARGAGLEVHLTIMVGYPWETREDAERTVSLAWNLMRAGYADMLQATVVIPYPGTPLHDEAVAEGWFIVDPHDYDKFDMGQPVLMTPGIRPDEMMQICNTIYKAFLQPPFLLRHLARVRTWEDLAYLARGVRPVLGHLRDFKHK